jgi:hypothetical protein
MAAQGAAEDERGTCESQRSKARAGQGGSSMDAWTWTAAEQHGISQWGVPLGLAAPRRVIACDAPPARRGAAGRGSGISSRAVVAAPTRARRRPPTVDLAARRRRHGRAGGACLSTGRGATPLSGRAEPGGPAHRQCAVSRARSGCGGCEGIGEGEAKQLANSQCGVESRKRRCADGGHVGSASTVQKLLVTCWV